MENLNTTNTKKEETATLKNKHDIKVGDTVGNTVDGFNFEVVSTDSGKGLHSLTVRDKRTGEKKNVVPDNYYLPESTSNSNGKKTETKKKENYENMSVDELVKIKKQKYGNIDISEPMSDDEKLLTKIIAKKFSDINKEIKDKKRQAENKEIEELRKAYDFLIENPTDDEKITKKNLTILLKKNFKNVKFSIRKKYWKTFTISWTADLTKKEVNKIANMFDAYSFDSYTDCHDYSPSLFNKLFGGFRYIWTEKI